MDIQNYYKTRHSSALNKISGRLTEGREFIASFDIRVSPAENSQKAYLNRWYGNSSERKCKELTSHFYQRYIVTSENFESLRMYIQMNGGADFQWLNHFFMLLDDPYYRWATSGFMLDCFNNGLYEIPRLRFDQELKKQVPVTVGAGSLIRYGQNLLTAIRDNGLLDGTSKKIIVSPALFVRTLAFMLYSLSDFGAGSSEFESSPLLFSMLKPRPLLISVFLEGEQLGYWDFTGDRQRIAYNLNFKDLKNWIEACIL